MSLNIGRFGRLSSGESIHFAPKHKVRYWLQFLWVDAFLIETLWLTMMSVELTIQEYLQKRSTHPLDEHY